MVELLHFWRGAKLPKQEVGVVAAGYDSSMFDVAYLVGKDYTL